MKRYDVVDFIEETPTVHGVFEESVQTTRRAFVEVRSVSRSEWYSANAQNINATVVFVLTVEADYQQEKELYYHDQKYRVVRTYVTDDGIELTCEPSRYPEPIEEGGVVNVE